MAWFLDIQRKYPTAHISCAGRGKEDQEDALKRGASKAHWKQSSHNYNCAVDIFELEGDQALWDRDWFDLVVGSNLKPFIKWYGSPGAVFYELPHCERSDWKDRLKQGLIAPVE